MRLKEQWYYIAGRVGFQVFMKAAVFTENVDQAPLTVTERKSNGKRRQRALRAIYYFYLVRTYGPVPLLEMDFPMDTPSDELQLSRNTVDECFDFIVSELKGAQNDGLLDDASTDKVSGYGRIDKAIAQAFIIEALTYRAAGCLTESALTIQAWLIRTEQSCSLTNRMKLPNVPIGRK